MASFALKQKSLRDKIKSYEALGFSSPYESLRLEGVNKSNIDNEISKMDHKLKFHPLQREYHEIRNLVISKTGVTIPYKTYKTIHNLKQAIFKLHAKNNELSSQGVVKTLQQQQKEIIKQLKEFNISETNKRYNISKIAALRKRVDFLKKKLDTQIEESKWIAFKDLPKAVSSLINTKGRFEITIQGRHSTREYTYTFTHFAHLENAVNEDSEVDSFSKNENINKQYFEEVKIVKATSQTRVGGCNRHSHPGNEQMINGESYIFTVHSPLSKDNSCAFQTIRYHTNTELSNKKICEALKLDLKEKKSIIEFKMMWDYVEKEKQFVVIDKNYNGPIIDETKYVLLDSEHFMAVKEAKEKEPLKEKRTRRVLATWDSETRQTDEYITIRKGCKDVNGKDISYRSYKLKDTITSFAYQSNRGEMLKRTFVTNDEKSSMRQFIDFLKTSKQKFKCYAHNGASFDNYFFLANLTEEEFRSCKITKLGLRFAQIEIFGHNLTDSRLHLIASLDTLCKDYRVETAKLTKFIVNGKILTNTEMCFYKPHLKFNEFMDLQRTEPEFWSLYQMYCETDCISLYQVWFHYSQSMRQISEKMLGNEFGRSKAAGQTCVDKALTIGSGAMRLLEASMMKHDRYMSCILKKFNDSEEKEEFLRHFIRGGISHTEQPGKHNYIVVDVDIASQYPAAMYTGKIPIGESRFVQNCQYSRDWNGYVKMRNVVFADHCKKNKFIANYEDRVDGTRSLNWHTPNTISELYLDTISINYYLSIGDLLSFEVERALISNLAIEGCYVYGLYIDTLYKLKAIQDNFKSKSSESYNPSMRASIKLLLNSVSGKCIEDKMKYKTLLKEKGSETQATKVNGYDMYLQDEKQLNPFLPTGLTIYSMSKILLREYVNCLPNGADDMIHAETDGFMFNKKHLDYFKQKVSEYQLCHAKVKDVRKNLPIAIGKNIGNLEIACESLDNEPSYFLGKKNYLMAGASSNGKDLARLKGIPQKTINDDGSERVLVLREHYQKMYEGEKVTFTFPTLLKTIRSTVAVSTHNITRSIHISKKNFKEYF